MVSLKAMNQCVWFLFMLTMLIGVTESSFSQVRPHESTSSVPVGTQTLVVKISPYGQANQRSTNSADIQKIAEKVGASSFNRLTNREPGLRSRKKYDFGVDRIFLLNFNTGADLNSTLKELKSDPEIEYAEPWIPAQQLLIPNDPFANPELGDNGQEYLSIINAYDSWEISTGSDSVLIAITDSGIPLDHEDLQENFYININDTIDGIDNDGNGFVDDFQGWDAADNDNDQTPEYETTVGGFSPGHGTLVTGIAGADTDNNTGIAGVGYNTPFLSIKNSRSSDGAITAGYQSILVAAELGAAIINCSWGRKESTGGFSQAEQDIINEAVFNYDAVVVAAAGNDGDDFRFYPASYDQVLSVTSTNASDERSGFSSYNFEVDVMAPGQSELSTEISGGYQNAQGTSFSAPMVAGAAALLRAHRPELSAIQVMERIRVATEDTYLIGNNSNFQDQLGFGRLDMQEALANDSLRAFRITDTKTRGPVSNLLFYGDTVTVNFSGLNVLNPMDNLALSASSASSFVNFVNQEVETGPLATLEEYNSDQTFSFYLDPFTPADEALAIRIGMSGQDYEDYQYLRLKTAPSFLNLQTDSLELTVSSNGNLGFDKDGQTDGVGFTFDGDRIAKHFGIMLGTSPETLSNNVINNYATSSRDDDFEEVNLLKLFPNERTSIDLSGRFEAKNPEMLVDVVIDQQYYSWDSDTTQNFLVVEYRVNNIGDDTLSNLPVAMYMDWDIGNAFQNRIEYDSSLGFGYAYDSAQRHFATVTPLTEEDPVFYAVDRQNFGGNPSDLNGITFTREEKFEFISQGIGKGSAGLNGSGNDIAQISGVNLNTLLPGQSAKIAWAWAVSTSPEALSAAVGRAKDLYRIETQNPAVQAKAVICRNDDFELLPSGGETYRFYSDPLGTNLIGTGISLVVEAIDQDTLFYFEAINGNLKEDVAAFEIITKGAQVEFTIDPDTLYLNSEPAFVSFTDQTEGAQTRLWDFDNGFQSTLEAPLIAFDTPGTYNIVLNVTDSTGCEVVGSRELLVVNRSPLPQVDNQLVCISTTTQIEALNTDSIAIYADEALTNLLFTGSVFTTPVITEKTEFYVVNLDGELESFPVKVTVDVLSPEPALSYAIDTTDTTLPSRLILTDRSGRSVSRSWFENGMLIGSDSIQLFEYPNTAFDILMVSQDENACADTAMVTIIPAVSPAPEIGDILVCQNGRLSVRPEGGSIFYFFADQQRSQLLKKGRSLEIAELREPTTFFIATVDSLIESELVEITAEFYPLEADFIFDPDSVNLAESQQVTLSNRSIEASAAFWFYDGVLWNNANDTILTITESTDQTFALIAQNNFDCRDTVFKTLRVFSITAVTDAISMEELSIYPNPVSGHLFVRHSADWNAWALVNALGERVASGELSSGSKDKSAIPMQDIKPGLYFLRLFNQRGYSEYFRVFVD
jgi:hypothetical protein